MVIFNSYVKLPEGKLCKSPYAQTWSWISELRSTDPGWVIGGELCPENVISSAMKLWNPPQIVTINPRLAFFVLNMLVRSHRTA